MQQDKKPLISVIIPCYNAMPFLPVALDSIINQTYKNLEILCINDGSTDKTPEILENYAKIDNRIRVIHNKTNLKLIRTLNKGIDLANGEYIARMDADDVSLPQRIEKQVHYLMQNKVDIVSAFADFVSETGKTSKGMRTVYTKYPYTLFYTFFINPFIHPTVLAKSKVLKKNKYSTEPRALHNEDYELWTRVLRNGYKIEIFPEVLLLYRFNRESVSSRNIQLQLDNFTYNLQNHIQSALNIRLTVKECALITYNANHVQKLGSSSTHFIKKINSAFLQQFQKVDIDKIAFISNNHVYRIKIFSLRNARISIFKMKLMFQVIFGLRKYFKARKKL